MKRYCYSILAAVTAAAIVTTGCSSNLRAKNPPESPSSSQMEDNGTGEAGEAESSVPHQAGSDRFLLGLGVVSSTSGSKDAGDQDGLAQVDTTVAAVTIDTDGRIENCVIDGIRVNAGFAADGSLLTDPSAEFPSKNELGAAYGMGRASSIGKEWSEEAAAFAEYVKGKTAEEVKGIAVTPQGTPAAKDLSASVTVHIGDFMEAVEKACDHSRDLYAKPGDRLGLGVTTTISSSKSADDQEDGLVMAESTFTAVTFEDGGLISSCLIDSVRSSVNFDSNGKITGDREAVIRTKNEIGDEYGMKKASSIGKEWYEQAEAFARYAVGKTAGEVEGISVNEADRSALGPDLRTSVTIGIGDFKECIRKAAQAAR